MYRIILVGILGVSLMSLTACESMSGKTTGQTIDDATITASVQGKLTSDKLSNFSRIDVDTKPEHCHAEWCGAYSGRTIAGRRPRAACGRGDESE